MGTKVSELSTINQSALASGDKVYVVDVDAADDMEADVVDMEMDDEKLEEGTKKGGDRKTARRAYDKKNESTEDNDELVEQITKRVAARILKSALAKK